MFTKLTFLYSLYFKFRLWFIYRRIGMDGIEKALQNIATPEKISDTKTIYHFPHGGTVTVIRQKMTIDERL